MNQTTIDGLSTQLGTSTGARVLIVDDEACISDLIAEMLNMLGYAPTKTESPQEALELLEQQEFDVILSDFRMPLMNGDVFFRNAIAKNAGLKTRFVFLTGDSVSEGTSRFLTEHRCRHLCKPFDIASVEQVISEVVSEHAIQA